MPESRAPTQDEINSRVYHAHGISRWYTNTGLDRAETMALLKYREAFVGRRILDIGVGTGRTSIYLSALAERYVGIDYSTEMIEHMQRVYPQIDSKLCDMRDLSAWGSGTFDFVFASNNVIDAVSHSDRLRVLSEFHRVSSAGALLVLTSHNRHYRFANCGPRLEYSHNPVTQARRVASYFRCRLNHMRIRGLRHFEDEYALLNDKGHDYSLLHYYIDRSHQRLQLQAMGYRLLETFDHLGRSLLNGDEGTDSASLMYIASRE